MDVTVNGKSIEEFASETLGIEARHLLNQELHSKTKAIATRLSNGVAARYGRGKNTWHRDASAKNGRTRRLSPLEILNDYGRESMIHSNILTVLEKLSYPVRIPELAKEMKRRQMACPHAATLRKIMWTLQKSGDVDILRKIGDDFVPYPHVSAEAIGENKHIRAPMHVRLSSKARESRPLTDTQPLAVVTTEVEAPVETPDPVPVETPGTSPVALDPDSVRAWMVSHGIKRFSFAIEF